MVAKYKERGVAVSSFYQLACLGCEQEFRGKNPSFSERLN